MAITIEAVYENGVLKPAQPLPLKEHERVRVTVEAESILVQQTYGMIGWKGDHETLERLLAEAEELP
jgi:predicted DNA-binding antitoxin AbrB/MazE fold protein